MIDAIVGKFYAVPCVRVPRRFYGTLWVPVIGPKHRDIDLGVDLEHWHIDWRFVSVRVLNGSTNPMLNTPHGKVISNDGEGFVRTLTGAPAVLKRRLCKRAMPDFPAAPSRIIWAAMEAAQRRRCDYLKDGHTCPHRGIDLRPFVKADGTAICPGLDGAGIDVIGCEQTPDLHAVMSVRTSEFIPAAGCVLQGCPLMRGRMMALTAERLREVLDYDPLSGVFRWRISVGRAQAGTVSGCLHHTGYRHIAIDGVRFASHRLAWLHMHGAWPDDQIDHINGQRDDNRIANLRDVSARINAQNQQAKRRNGSGLLGVARQGGAYRAEIMAVDGTRKYLGRFSTPEAAHAAYLAAKRLLHEGCTI